jgi:hypothetical protein
MYILYCDCTQIFCLFGKGHAASIVKMACEANAESVTLLQAKGRYILSGKKPRRSISSRPASKDADDQPSEEWIRLV